MVDEEIGKPGLGFSEVARSLTGERSIKFIKFFLIIMQWGCCASYILFFMEFIEYAFFNSYEQTWLHELIYICLALCVILPMSLIDNFAKFARFSVPASVLN